MLYTEIFTDPEGLSRFREVSAFYGADDPAAGILQTGTQACSAQFLRIRAGFDSGWHHAPDDGFAVLLRGTVEIEVADGEIRRFAPGEVWRSTDTTGRGHVSRVPGPEDAHVFMTHLLS